MPALMGAPEAQAIEAGQDDDDDARALAVEDGALAAESALEPQEAPAVLEGPAISAPAGSEVGSGRKSAA